MKLKSVKKFKTAIYFEEKVCYNTICGSKRQSKAGFPPGFTWEVYHILFPM